MGRYSCPTARRSGISAVMPWKVNSYTWRITGSYMLTGGASSQPCTLLQPVSPSLRIYKLQVTLRQFILVLSSVELTSVWTKGHGAPQFWLQGNCREFVQCSQFLYSGRAAQLPCQMPIARAMWAMFKAFSFPVIESYSVVPVFRSSVFSSIPDREGIAVIHYSIQSYMALGYHFCLGKYLSSKISEFL